LFFHCDILQPSSLSNRSRELGGLDFIAKPFNVATLIGTVGHHSKKMVNLPTSVSNYQPGANAKPWARPEIPEQGASPW